jgi:DNA-binding NarL/FixJ family response regulator
MEVVAEAGDAGEVLRAVVEQRPDVAICDLRIRRMAHADGLRLAIAIRYEHPDTAVAVLTPSWRSYPLESIGDEAEGVGYLPKQRVADAASFVESVRRVAAGGSASVAAMMRARQSWISYARRARRRHGCRAAEAAPTSRRRGTSSRPCARSSRVDAHVLAGRARAQRRALASGNGVACQWWW